jgi:glycosyltransferase involved in cell wall biosynthesis
VKIAVLTDFLDYPPSGIGVYLSDLLEKLLSMDHDNEYLLIHERKSSHPLYAKAPHIILARPAIHPRNTIRKNILLPRLLAREHADLFHEPQQITPVLVKTHCPRVLNIHDVFYTAHPLLAPYLRRCLARSCRLADRVITCSDYSKNEIVERLGAQAGKVSVIYNALSDRWKPSKKRSSVSERYGLEENGYILYVGGYDPRKNLLTLLSAFKQIIKRHPGQMLAMVGEKIKQYEQVRSRVESLGLVENVKFLGLIPHDQLPALYTQASLFVMPSLSEGFGYPPLEAMACKTPVVSSNATSLPEVVGDAGLLVDARKPEELAYAMQRILDDAGLRRRLVQKGVKQAKRFSLKNSAEKMLEVYREAAR